MIINVITQGQVYMTGNAGHPVQEQWNDVASVGRIRLLAKGGDGGPGGKWRL